MPKICAATDEGEVASHLHRTVWNWKIADLGGKFDSCSPNIPFGSGLNRLLAVGSFPSGCTIGAWLNRSWHSVRDDDN